MRLPKDKIIIILAIAIISILVVSALLYVGLGLDLDGDDNDENNGDDDDNGPDDEPVDNATYEASVTLLPDISGSTNANLTIFCDIANTTADRQQGLMYVSNLSLDRGMLFIFDEPDTRTFWMKNVEIPLDIVFIDEDMKVLNVEEAIVEDNATLDIQLIRYHSDGPALYVLEMNYGLAAENNITAGAEVIIEYP